MVKGHPTGKKLLCITWSSINPHIVTTFGTASTIAFFVEVVGKDFVALLYFYLTMSVQFKEQILAVLLSVALGPVWSLIEDTAGLMNGFITLLKATMCGGSQEPWLTTTP